MKRKAKRVKQSPKDVASAATESVQDGMESIKSAAGKVVDGAAKIGSDVAAKVKSVVSNIAKMVK